MRDPSLPEPSSDVNPGITRRLFEHCLVGLIPLTFAAGSLFAAVKFLLPFGKRRLPKLDVGPADQFAGDLVKEVEFNEDDVFVLRTDDGIRAFKRKCPHLGCAIAWVNTENEFHCNCHGMAWTRNGKFIKGPVDEGIAPQAFEVEGNRVILKDEPASES